MRKTTLSYYFEIWTYNIDTNEFGWKIVDINFATLEDAKKYRNYTLDSLEIPNNYILIIIKNERKVVSK